ncbi:MAG: alanine racemase [Luteibaculum sp.]
MFNSSRIEISKQAFKHNLSFLKELLTPGTEISLVAKGNAYGHGIEQMVGLAEECDVRHFSVYSAEEAQRVYQAAQKRPTILIMGYLSSTAFAWAVENEIEFFVFEMERLKKALEAAKKVGKKARVHLELETGMHRTGFEVAELPEVVELIKNNEEHFQVAGICTHFAGAESISNYVRIKKQKRAFKKYVKYLDQLGLAYDKVHACCSAASIRHPDMHYDMVRIGIMHYGFWPSEEIFIEYSNQHKTEGKDPLKRLITWKSEIMSLKFVEKGKFIGYGTSYLAHEDTTIALVPVGYGYGFSRTLSNTGRVLIHGVRAGVVGIVNMNCLAVNITNFQDVKIGDEVILIGGEGDNQISVSSFGRFSEQLNYELLTRLPQDIPRIII